MAVTINGDGTITGAPVGKVLQVLQAVKTDTFSFSGDNTDLLFTDITGLSVSITPSSASSKILVFGDVFGASDVNGEVALKLLRDSTTIYLGDALGSRTRAVGAAFYDNNDVEQNARQTFIFLDSPSTTSSTTYKIQVGGQNGNQYINRGQSDGDTDEAVRGASSITVMEIAG